MSKYRTALPQLSDQPVITDGGLETQLVFQDGMELPEFASFPLLFDAAGRERLSRYLDDYVAIAQRHGVALLAESCTWRASADWVEKLGYGRDQVQGINRQAIDLMARYREQQAGLTMIISGCLGPRGDGYQVEEVMSVEQASDYHRGQIDAFAASDADIVSALTMNNTPEAIGVALAAKEAQMPCAISFTVETDGCLPSGQPLGEAVQEVDDSTEQAPAYYMLNCAHPVHFANLFTEPADWHKRFRGIRANASMKSHAELDEMTQLDSGDPADLGQRMQAIGSGRSKFNIMGGCCGTDHRHIAAICEACFGDANR